MIEDATRKLCSRFKKVDSHTRNSFVHKTKFNLGKFLLFLLQISSFIDWLNIFLICILNLKESVWILNKPMINCEMSLNSLNINDLRRNDKNDLKYLFKNGVKVNNWSEKFILFEDKL